MSFPTTSSSISNTDLTIIQASVAQDLFERFGFLMIITCSLLDTCQKKCIVSNSQGDLEVGEQVCIDRCTKKFFEAYQMVVTQMDGSVNK